MKQSHKDATTSSIKCKEEHCDFTCRSIKQLREHLMKYHGLHFDTEMLQFENAQGNFINYLHVVCLHPILDAFLTVTDIEFQEWKEHIEMTTDSEYVKATGIKKSGENEVSYYYCNRSGFPTSKGSGVRSLKSQGSSKIGAHCTSTIIATQTKNCRISAEICRTHYRHTNTLGHLRLPAVKRTEIAGQIS